MTRNKESASCKMLSVAAGLMQTRDITIRVAKFTFRLNTGRISMFFRVVFAKAQLRSLHPIEWSIRRASDAPCHRS